MKKLASTIFLATLLTISASAEKKNVNYDESKVKPYTLQDPLTFFDGKKVKDVGEWPERRAEILEIFQKEMYGRIPKSSPIYLETLEEGETLAGYGIRKQVRMWFREDKTGPSITWLIILPRFEKGPVPAIITLNYMGNHSITDDTKIIIPEGMWLRNDKRYGITEHKPLESMRGLYAGENRATIYPLQMIINRGYAFVTASYGDVSPDPDKRNGDDQETLPYTDIFELWGKRDPKRTDNTTSLGAWAWALMRGMDMIEKEPAIDAKCVMVTGCSRLGKAALVAGAYDERFAVVTPVQTGGGGVPLAKRNFGETVATETAAFTHWYCKAYSKYADNEEKLPFDQHMLLSCIAPRALLIEGFDGKWFDTKGEFLSAKAASPVWEFLGKKGLPDVEMPADYEQTAIGENLGYVRRSQDHGTSGYDWKWMLDFADNVFKKIAKAQRDRCLP